MTATAETTPAPSAEAPTAPAQAPATTPAETAPAAPEANTEKSAAPALSPEQDAHRKQVEAQIAVQQVIKSKEDACAAEIAAVAEKHGCELIVGHSVKVRFKSQG